MRVASHGYIDLWDHRRVKTPGYHDQGLDPVPESEAIAFLLSHSFRGHRRVVLPLSVEDRKRIRLALWADLVSERMTLGEWVYPLYFDGDVTRVIPLSGTPFAEVPEQVVFEFDLERKTA